MIEAAGKRRYEDVAEALRKELAEGRYKVGDRMKPERQISEDMGVSRSLVREAIIRLEIEGLVDVRKGSGTYVVRLPAGDAGEPRGDIGPFELLQARQVLESSIAAFAATTVTKADILRMREALEMERRAIEDGSGDYSGDELFHHLIAEATQNSVLVDMIDELWGKREQSPMWERLHARIFDVSYRGRWLEDHQAILTALQCKDPRAARQAMWQHLENVRQTLMELSDVDDPEFDGFLFDSRPAAAAVS
ncbi:FCD domain-containing protein [Microvirga tunisiensis]|uniref:FCD domain-containing protein n=2 Tax=Pannonibacter tanglangensis TaxID=2750084 RepID=A0A7X5F2V3_9HYPH|nr:MULTISPECIES: FCD domain-containing protein [unclassified Pannonibacter]NBN64228.1 FCD domain-containing protein [Pannonibacter sp. XCT-34]NBN78761.1 FCD domain-containing protein [Pannonibacter sp. XCT-53]